MEDSLQKLVHDLRSNHYVIRFSIDMLEEKSTVLKPHELQEMLTRNLANTQSLLRNLASYKGTKNTSDSSGEVMIEVSRLLHYLETKKLTSVPAQIQDELHSLIHRLQTVSAPSKS